MIQNLRRLLLAAALVCVGCSRPPEASQPTPEKQPQPNPEQTPKPADPPHKPPAGGGEKKEPAPALPTGIDKATAEAWEKHGFYAGWMGLDDFRRGNAGIESRCRVDEV